MMEQLTPGGASTPIDYEKKLDDLTADSSFFNGLPSRVSNSATSLWNWMSSSEEIPEEIPTPEDNLWEGVANQVEPVVNPMIRGVMAAHSTRMGLDKTSATSNALEFATFVGLVENSGQTYGANTPEEGKEQTSAQGLYQFLDDDSLGQSSWQTGLNRTRKYLGPQDWITESYEYGKGGVNLATRNQQTAVFLGNLLEQKGSDAYMRPILEGNRDSWVDSYLKLHYKGKPTEATIKHVNEVYDSMNVKVRF